MRLRSLLRIAATAAVLVTPVVTLAQPGGVTVAPVGTAAPALNGMLLVVSAIMLAVIATVILRRNAVTIRSGIALVAAMSVLAGVGYGAAFTTVISGDDCAKETTKVYTTAGDQTLESQCPNAIQIVDFVLPCSPVEVLGEAETVPSCTIGLVLTQGDLCDLPTCPT